ncbi:MAG TPA: AEC family transporter [Lachnospiraceae bacterium]|nr:AEC family transporter [Lachnospiraceae bacterium]
MSELLRKLLPILILIVIGFYAKQKKLFSESFIEGLKVLIINIALPAVLFDAFSKMTLQVSYLLLFVLIFLYCVLLYLLGVGLNKAFPKVFKRIYTKGYMTGFEFGMIGVGLFGAIWGMDQLPVIMLIGFGHELFIWFFYVILISKTNHHSFDFRKTIGHFLKTPTIIAIILGIIANLSGIRQLMDGNVMGQSLLSVIEFLKPLTSPLILIVIGYTMVFHNTNVRETATYILSRLVLVLGLGTLVLFITTHLIHGLDSLFITAFYAFILLPAPYILPLYIQDEGESAFFTQLLVYSTVVSFIGYGILVALGL